MRHMPSRRVPSIAPFGPQDTTPAQVVASSPRREAPAVYNLAGLPVLHPAPRG